MYNIFPSLLHKLMNYKIIHILNLPMFKINYFYHYNQWRYFSIYYIKYIFFNTQIFMQATLEIACHILFTYPLQVIYKYILNLN